MTTTVNGYHFGSTATTGTVVNACRAGRSALRSRSNVKTASSANNLMHRGSAPAQRRPGERAEPEVSSHPREGVGEFDYGSVPSSVAKFLKGQAERIRRGCALSIIHIGKDLIAAKHYLDHGAFIRWVECEVGIPARTAQAYMQVAHWISGKSATVARLPPSMLYVLSAPDIAETFALGVLERIESGEQVTVSAIREELKALRGSRPEGRRNRTGEAQQTIPHDAAVESIAAATSEPQPTVLDAVRILASRLSEADFIRIRDIMMSLSVLDDPELPRKIAVAFRTVGDAAGNSQRPDQQAPLAA